jgi:hypothetical protein
MADQLSDKELYELLKPKTPKIVLIYKYCLKHHTPTWHLLCASGEFVCLECYLESSLKLRALNAN